MSISQLLQPNNYNLFGKSLNGITQEEITGSNENGQVLTLVNKDEKIVAFTDAPETTPPTIGQPDGYVLAIKNNTTGELEWKQDAQGSIPDPLVLSGANSINKFQVQDNSFNKQFNVDTVGGTVSIGGVPAKGKLEIKNSLDETVFNVDTNLDIGNVFVNGANYNQKFVVFDSVSQKSFTVNTDETEQPVSVGGVPLPLVCPIYSKVEATLPTNDWIGYIVKNGNANFYLLSSNLGQCGMYFDANESLLSNGSGTMTINGEGQTIIQKDGSGGNPTAVISQKPTGTSIEDDIKVSISGNAGGSVLNIGDAGNNITTTSNLLISGDASTDKFVVRDEQDNKIFWVETISDSIFLGGSNSGAKWGVFDTSFNLQFLLDTNNKRMILGNHAGNFPKMMVDYRIGQYTTVVLDDQPGGYITTNTLAGGGQMRMLSGYDGTQNNIIESTGSAGLVISSDDLMTITAGTQLTINSPCDFSTTLPTSTITPVGNTSLTPKFYVDNKIGFLASGISASLTAQGAVVGDQVLDPQSFQGSPTVFPNTFQIGDSFNLTASGNCSYSNGDPVIIKVNSLDGSLNVTNLATITISAPNTGASFFEIEADFTVRNIVAGIADVVSSVDFTYQDGGSFIGSRSLTITNTLDTTEPQVLQLVTDLSGANASSTMTTQLYVLKRTH